MIASTIKSRYWAALEASHQAGAWEALDAAYGNLARAYHSWRHISDLLQAFEKLTVLSARPELIMTAIFWHDVVYRTRDAGQSRRADFLNVQDSAEMFLRYARMNSADAEAVQELIMATTNHLDAKPSRERYADFSRDLDLFVDLDLSPLALPWKQFASNFEDIRFRIQFDSGGCLQFGPGRLSQKSARSRGQAISSTGDGKNVESRGCEQHKALSQQPLDGRRCFIPAT